jgi:hypothetical protein
VRGRVRAGRHGRLLLVLALVALDVVLIAIFAAQVQPNSDGMQHYLELRSLWQDNWLLSLWVVGYDNFYLTDLPFYVAGAAIKGLSPSLVYLAPAAIYTALLLAALLLIARGVERREQAWIAVPAWFVLLGLPAVRWPQLAGGNHIATILFAVLAFIALRPLLRGDRLKPLPLVCFLLCVFAGAESDPYAHFFTAGPVAVFLAGRFAMTRETRRHSLILFLLTAGVAYLGYRFPEIMPRLGGFQTIWSLSGKFAPLHLWGESWTSIALNTAKVTGWLAPALGDPVGAIQILRAAVTILAAILCFSLIARPWRRQNEIGLILLLAAAIPLGAAAVSMHFLSASVPNGYGEGARYLMPSVVFGSIAAAIELPNLIERLRSRRWRGVALGAASIAGLILVGDYARNAAAAAALPRGIDTVWQRQLADWLVRHDLHRGIGDYWTARVAAVVGREGVTMAAVFKQPAPSRKLQAFLLNASFTEYAAAPQFVAFTEPNVFGISLETIRATYGELASVHRLPFRWSDAARSEKARPDIAFVQIDDFRLSLDLARETEGDVSADGSTPACVVAILAPR